VSGRDAPAPRAISALDIDPLDTPKTALAGRVVTMDARRTVLDHGVVWLEKGSIAAVTPRDAPTPAGFQGVAPIATRGAIYPGLIELHNHLAYDALPLWQVPERYANRDKWSGIPAYRKLISGPMQVLGRTPGLLPALIRYVECKCLAGGVTTSQGIELFSNRGARRFYRGVVRNVENTEDAALPDALTKISDVEAEKAERFLARLSKQTCFLLHLSEGIDDGARAHFRSLELSPGRWAITPALAGIHCAALEDEDFEVLGRLGGAMVWSPLSNLLLYGKTARVKAARRHHVRIGLGSDWSPSGSKNLLCELKVARIASGLRGDPFSDEDLVAMATCDAAAILQWDKACGSIEAGKRADLIVVDEGTGDPYARLVDARESDLTLVMIAGVARLGVPSVMERLGPVDEKVTIGARDRVLNLRQPLGDPDVGAISLAEAKTTLARALRDLPALAKRLEQAAVGPQAIPGAAPAPLTWSLALDELEHTGMALRPRLARDGRATGPTLAASAASKPLSEILEPVELDPLTVVDDDEYLKRLAAQPNLPKGIADGLKACYA
jgi:5-methylthioadenosine/S-adenosylhomocysteine deaminase